MKDSLRLEVARLVRRADAWGAILGGVLLFLVGITLERSATPPSEARDVFGRAAFPLLFSLAAMAIAQGVSGGEVPSGIAKLLLRVGGSRAKATISTVLPVVLVSLVLLPLLGFLAMRITRDVPTDQETLVLGILVLSAPAYATFYSLGLTFGVRGVGIFWFLDYFIGSSGGPLSLVFPRSHLRNLIGASPPMGISPYASSFVLLGLPVAYVALSILRARKNLWSLREEA